jgi:hypothetical protein
MVYCRQHYNSQMLCKLKNFVTTDLVECQAKKIEKHTVYHSRSCVL